MLGNISYKYRSPPSPSLLPEIPQTLLPARILNSETAATILPLPPHTPVSQLTMPKGMRKPVPYAELAIGGWYQARFEFKDHDNSTGVSSATSATRATARNKSHRVMVLTKFTNPDDPASGRAICVFLTSFGGHLNLNTCITNPRDRLKYISVNSLATTLYSSIPISVSSLYGYVNFVSEYELPVGGGEEAVVRMREAGRDGGDIRSPGWVVPYIAKLKVAWVGWMLGGAIVTRWLDIAAVITAEFGSTGLGTEVVAERRLEVDTEGCSTSTTGAKRLRDDEDDQNAEVKATGKGLKRSRNAAFWLDGANDSDDADDSHETSEPDDGSADISESEKNDDPAEFADDSGIHVIDFEEATVEAEVDSNVQAEINVPVKREPPVYRPWTPLILLSVEFYEMQGDEDDIDDEVDFALLEALLRPFPEY